MVRLLNDLDVKKFSPRQYIVAQSDHASHCKIKELEKHLDSSPEDFQITTISRSREVKQSWASTAVSFIRSTFESIRIIGFYHPDLILCNGPGTCVPICLVAFIFKVNLEKKRTENLNYLCKLFKILGIVVKKHNNCIRGKHLSSSFPLAYWENYGYTFG